MSAQTGICERHGEMSEDIKTLKVSTDQTNIKLAVLIEKMSSLEKEVSGFRARLNQIVISILVAAIIGAAGWIFSHGKNSVAADKQGGAGVGGK